MADPGEVAEPLQYADYSEWQNELQQKNDEEAAAAKNYWKQNDFSSIPPLVLPFQSRPNPTAAFEPDSVSVQLNDELLKRIDQASSGDRANFLLAAWQVLLSRLAAQPEVVVGVVSDGRSHEELSSALGLFARALPIHANFDEPLTFSEILQHTQKSQSEASEFQDYLELSGEELAAGFAVEHRFEKQSAAGVDFSAYRQRAYSNRFHLLLRCVIAGDRWNVELVYDRAYFRRDVVERVAERLSSCSLQPQRSQAGRLTHCRLCRPPTPADRRLIHQTSADFPREQCIHFLFEDQAALKPDLQRSVAGNSNSATRN